MSLCKMWLGSSGNEILLIPSGRKFTENDVKISRQKRMASGKLVQDLITTKKNFSLSYGTTTNAVMEQLETIYAIGGVLSFIVERKDTTTDTYSVIMGPIQRQRINAKGTWLVSISVSLEEV